MRDIPRFDLKRVRALLPNAFIGESVAKRANEQLLAPSHREADKYIRAVVAALTEADFYESKQLAYAQQLAPKPVLLWFDVYGVQDAEGRWYVKLRIDQETSLLIVSCHGPEYDLKLRSGKVIKKWTK